MEGRRENFITINALSWSAKPASPSVGSMQFRCWHVSSPFRDVIERRACETFKNYRQHYVISRHVGGPLGDVSWQPFLFLESPWGGVGQFVQVRASPVSIRICVPNLVAVRRSGRKMGGGGTDRQTNGHCNFIQQMRTHCGATKMNTSDLGPRTNANIDARYNFV